MNIIKTSINFILLLLLPLVGIAQFNSTVDFIATIGYSNKKLISESNIPFVIDAVHSENVRTTGKISGSIKLYYNKRISNMLFFKTGINVIGLGNKIVTIPEIPEDEASQLSFNYLFLEIPVMIRTQLNEKKFSPFIEVGFSPARYVFTQKKILNVPAAARRNINVKLENPSAITLIGIVSFGFNYLYNENYQIIAQAFYRKHLTSLESTETKAYLNNYGIELGLRKKIN